MAYPYTQLGNLALSCLNHSYFQACDSRDLSLFQFFYIFFYRSAFASKCSKRSSYQGKKEVVVSKPLVFCLWGCGESVNPPKSNIQEVQGGLCPLDQRETQVRCPFFRICLLLSNYTLVFYYDTGSQKRGRHTQKVSRCRKRGTQIRETFPLRNCPPPPPPQISLHLPVQ